MAELILGGRFETMDLARFGTGRILRREPYAEMGIV
jgi:hypothetical protein